MKSQMILILFFLVSLLMRVTAQNCEPFDKFEDKFTKKKHILYGGVLAKDIVFSSKDLLVMLLVGTVNDTLCSAFYITKYLDEDNFEGKMDTKEDFKIKQGQNAYLVLSNGENIQITANYDSRLDKKKQLSTVYITVSATYSFTKEQLEQLAQSPITDFRIDLAEVSPIQGKVKSKMASKLKEQFECANIDLIAQKQ